MLTKEKVIEFYEGDVAGGDLFWSDKKAYVTWNALLFPGISAEEARSKENRLLNPAFLERIDLVEEISYLLVKAMEKTNHDQNVFRVERKSDYDCFLKNGVFTSFLSTSTAGFLDAYKDKKGLVLMKITIPEGTRCLDFSSVLKHYEKKEESEILLPPYTSFIAREKEMDEKILAIKDGDGNRPVDYVQVIVGKPVYKNIQPILFQKKWIESGKRCYEAWNHLRKPASCDIQDYLSLKICFQNRLQERIQKYE